MALTKITQGVIKPGENFDTHNINSTGIITATEFHGDGSNLTGLSDPSVLTYSGSTKVEAVSTGATVIGSLSVAGNVTATGNVSAFSFSGDGSGLTGVGGLGDGIGAANNLNYLFTSPELLELTANATVSATEAQGKVVFTASDSIKVATGVTVTVAVGTTIRTNVLNLY
jgi:hypothetical protein